MKRLTIQFFNFLNCIFYKLEEASNLNSDIDDPMDFPLKETEKDVIWSCILSATTWSYGAVLDKELRRVYEDNFSSFRRKFNINFSAPVRIRFTVFDIFFDVERLTWELLMEKLEYKLKIHHDPIQNMLLIPTTEMSQAYFIMDYMFNSMGKDRELNKNFRMIGPTGGSKTLVLNTFTQKTTSKLTLLRVPMSCYLSLERLR